jgi:hypothetical protein
MGNTEYFKLRLFQATLVAAALVGFTSCSGYQNPGNNSGKTGDGTNADSLKARKNDTGQGADLNNKELNRENDSIKKLKTL